jgi:hypothetical protein
MRSASKRRIKNIYTANLSAAGSRREGIFISFLLSLPVEKMKWPFSLPTPDPLFCDPFQVLKMKVAGEDLESPSAGVGGFLVKKPVFEDHREPAIILIELLS